MLTFTTLASGSGGNAALVSCGDTHLLLDAGISAKQITAGLAALGVAPRDLTAILITHEHSDHVSGLRVLSKRAAAPIYATGPTCRCLYDRNTGSEAADLLRVMEAGTGVQLGGLWVQSFPTPHDAAGSVGYILSGEGGRIVLATDLGYITPAVKTAVQDCGLLICEANHDEDWVRSGPYPYYLKQRILGTGATCPTRRGRSWPPWRRRAGPVPWSWPTSPGRTTPRPAHGRRPPAASEAWAVSRTGISP